MKKVEGMYFPYKNKEDLDLSEVNVVRFNIDELNYIDVHFKNGSKDTIHISGSSSIQIMPTASNCIDVKIKELVKID